MIHPSSSSVDTAMEFEFQAVHDYAQNGVPMIPLGVSAGTHLAIRERVSSVGQTGRTISCMDLKEMDRVHQLHKPSLVREHFSGISVSSLSLAQQDTWYSQDTAQDKEL